MRTMIILATAAAVLAACASPQTANLGPSEYQQLYKECRDRGGELKPIPGAISANDRANYACEFRGASPRTTGGSAG
jgi:hypothetical protein